MKTADENTSAVSRDKRRSATGEDAGQLADRLLVLLVLDFRKVARDLQQHALMGSDRPRRFFAETFVKIRDWRVEHTRDLIEPPGRDTVDAALVFMRLLVGHADHLGELLLGQTEHDATFANATADVVIDSAGRTPSLRFCHRFTYLCLAPGPLPAPRACLV